MRIWRDTPGRRLAAVSAVCALGSALSGCDAFDEELCSTQQRQLLTALATPVFVQMGVAEAEQQAAGVSCVEVGFNDELAIVSATVPGSQTQEDLESNARKLNAIASDLGWTYESAERTGQQRTYWSAGKGDSQVWLVLEGATSIELNTGDAPYD